MNGFLRTKITARLWMGPLQIQVWRDGAWVIAWNGELIYFTISSSWRRSVSTHVEYHWKKGL